MLLIDRNLQDDPAFLFVLRVKLRSDEHGGHTLAVTAWEGPHQEPNHTRIDVRARLVWTENGKRRSRTIFQRGDTWCAIASGHTLDGDDARELVLSLIAMKPGDTDADYFASYTKEQIAFAEEYGDNIRCEAISRYGER